MQTHADTDKTAKQKLTQRNTHLHRRQGLTGIQRKTEADRERHCCGEVVNQ